jgi:hypothetical protein
VNPLFLLVGGGVAIYFLLKPKQSTQATRNAKAAYVAPGTATPYDKGGSLDVTAYNVPGPASVTPPSGQPPYLLARDPSSIAPMTIPAPSDDTNYVTSSY